MTLEAVMDKITTTLDLVEPMPDSGEARRFLVKARDEVRAAKLRSAGSIRDRACPRCGARHATIQDTHIPHVFYCPICPGFFSTHVVSNEAATRFAKIGVPHTGATPTKLIFYDFYVPRMGCRDLISDHLFGQVASNGRREVFDMVQCPHCHRVWNQVAWESLDDCVCGQPVATARRTD